MIVLVAGRFWSRVLPLIGAAAITMPNKRIYVLPEHMHDEALITHELVHIRQMDRDGVTKFVTLYLYYLVTRGYWENPYEIEAFERDGRGMRKP
jgi:hypothetical protein